MSVKTRRIGLSLGADICWPLAYEEIMKRFDREIEYEGERIRFAWDRVTIEPFPLERRPKYDVVMDRLTHWYKTTREWIKKAVLLDGTYVFNNPWSLQSMEKHTAYAAMIRLGMPVPKTWLVPPKSYEETDDLDVTLKRYAKLFDLGKVGEEVGYPLFMKPYDGGAWVGVSKIDSEEQLREIYETSGTRVMHLQQAVSPYDIFVRCLAVGPQVRIMKYLPDAPLHARYAVDRDVVSEDDASLLRDMTLTINSFFGWDFNSCEALHKDGVYYPIDFANACPDSQVTSLHYHFPWVVLAKVKWSLFAAATQKKMNKATDWEPYFEIADTDAPYREKLKAYGAIARERMDVDRFEAFCTDYLGDLDEIATDVFASQATHDAVRQKVASLFPEHEVEQFSEHFWGLIQQWRETEGRTPVA